MKNSAKLVVGLGLIGLIGAAGFMILKPKAKAPFKSQSGVSSGQVDKNLPPVTVQVATGYAPVVLKTYDGSKIGTHLNLLDGFRDQGTVFFA